MGIRLLLVAVFSLCAAWLIQSLNGCATVQVKQMSCQVDHVDAEGNVTLQCSEQSPQSQDARQDGKLNVPIPESLIQDHKPNIQGMLLPREYRLLAFRLMN